MAEFKIGDKVVRKESLIYGGWELDCARNDRAVSEVFTVSGVWGDLLQLDGLPGHWKNDCFRPATGLEEHQNSALSAEERLRESDAHIECLRELLDIEKRRVSELQAEVSRCCGTVADKAAMEEKVAKLLSLNNELSDRVSDLADQREAAVFAAKSLGEDVRVLRANARLLRLYQQLLNGVLNGLYDALEDIDVVALGKQLGSIGLICEQDDNGADANMLYAAASVCEVLVGVIETANYLRDLEPITYPAIEAPLA